MSKITKNYLTSGEFAKLCDTTKVTLRHYKDIGILKPMHEGSNGYLYYEPEQFFDYYLIHILKKTGTSLSEIKSYMKSQDISGILDILQKQQNQLAEEKKEIERMEQVVRRSIANIQLGISNQFSEQEPQITYFEKEHLLAMPVTAFEAANEDDFISVLHKYVAFCQEHHLETDYQMGAVIPPENFLSGDITISHLYTKLNKPYKNLYYFEKPAGHYLTILNRGHWESQTFYELLIAYIKKHHIKVIGNLYAYDLAGYLLNGQEENTMTLISVQVDVQDK